MSYFLARIGRKPWARQLMPGMVMLTGAGYIGYHCLGHNLVRDLFVAELHDGSRDTLSVKLQNLIKDVYEDIKEDFCQPYMSNEYFNFPPPTIKWFATSSLSPIVLGFTNTKTGLSIGLPNHYNYDSIDDVPHDVYQVKKINLFKKSVKQEKGTQDGPRAEELIREENFEPEIEITSIDRFSPEGKSYAQSLILSENAKRYSVARELFIADTNRIYAKFALILVSGLSSITISRSFIKQLNLTKKHLAFRLPFYLTSCLWGFTLFKFINNSINEYYNIFADEKAARVSDIYKQGGIEYFEKLLQRNMAIRQLFPDMTKEIDESGNYKQSIIFSTNRSIEERLESVKNITKLDGEVAPN